MSYHPPVKTLERVVLILDCLSQDAEACSLADLSRRVSLPKSTIYRLLVSLEGHDITRRDEEHRRWHLGNLLQIWGAAAARQAPATAQQIADILCQD